MEDTLYIFTPGKSVISRNMVDLSREMNQKIDKMSVSELKKYVVSKEHISNINKLNGYRRLIGECIIDINGHYANYKTQVKLTRTAGASFRASITQISNLKRHMESKTGPTTVSKFMGMIIKQKESRYLELVGHAIQNGMDRDEAENFYKPYFY